MKILQVILLGIVTFIQIALGGSLPLFASPYGTSVYNCSTYNNGCANVSSLDVTQLTTIAGLSCPTTAQINSTISCTGSLPTNIFIGTSILKLNLTGQAQINCNFTFQTFICNNIPTGSTIGNSTIQAALNSATPANTATVVNITGPVPPAPQPVPDPLPADLVSKINSVTCSSDNTFYVGQKTTTCVVQLSSTYQLPTNFILGIGTTPGGSCTQNLLTITCTNVPISQIAGTLAILGSFGSNGNVFPLNFSAKLSVPNSGSTIRTGGQQLIKFFKENSLLILISSSTVILGIVLIVARKKQKLTTKPN